jgi:hypothetical protein
MTRMTITAHEIITVSVMGILWLNKVRVKIVLISSAFIHQTLLYESIPCFEYKSKS